MRRRRAKPFITIDAETDPFKYERMPEPFIWGTYDGLFFQHFDTTEKLVDYLRQQEVIAYAHNGGKFDFHFLLKYINLGEKIMVINGRLVTAKIGECELRDSWNILPVPQASFADKYEIEDFSIFEKEERNKPDNRLHIMQRLESDCIDLWNTIKAFEDDFGRHLTQASSSMQMWQQMSGLKKPQSDREFFQRFSKHYFGGRVQCFEKGVIKEPCEVVDINSAYPWAMLDKHPYGIEFTVAEYPKSVKPQSLVTVDGVSLGALPFRNEKGSIVFPNDKEKRRYMVTGHELIAAMDTNSIRDFQIVEAVDFVHLVSFKGYIEHFYNLRLEAKARKDKAGDVFYKLAMNSLYGKFGANPDNYGNYLACEQDDMEQYRQDGYTFDGILGRYALMRSPLEDWQQNFINVATAASITGKVRAHLWRSLCACEGIIYCDTDSIIAKRANVIKGESLGQWKVEGTGKEAYIVGKKTYVIIGDFGNDKKTGKKITHKKASKGANLTIGQLKKAALGETVVYKPDAPTFSVQRPPRWTPRKIRATG